MSAASGAIRSIRMMSVQMNAFRPSKVHELPASKAYIRPRPVRVAYLVEENERWKTMLDAIVAEAFGQWGGRFSLIVPCETGAIRPAYIPWLETYDPDIIYSYVDLSDAVIERYHEKLGPAFLVRHDFHRREERDLHAYRPHLPVAPLSALSVVAMLTRGDMISAPRPVALVDTQLGTPPSLFLQENFGCYSQSLSPWPIARDMGDYLKPVIFVPQHIQAGRHIMPRAEGEIVSSEKELIDRVASQRDLRGLAQISASFAPRIELGDMIWSRTVNLLVGDLFADRLIFWNALHHTPVWLGGGIAALKVSQDDLNDADRFNAIVNIIKNRIYLPVGGNASHAHIVVRSASVPAEELQQIANRLHLANKFNAYTWEHLASVDAPVPSASALKNARDHVEPGSPFQPHDWHEVAFTEDTFRPTLVLPRHLRDAAQLPASAKQGHWQLDLDIERTVDHSWVQNVQHHWRLPRRLRMVGAFTRGYRLHGMSSVCMPRSTASGLLSLTCATEGTLPELNVPTDEAAFRYAICAARDWWPFVRSDAKPKPGPALDMRPSDKGRYLTTLLRMSGNIHRAKEIFLSQFWKERFELLGSTPKATDDRVAAVTQRLKKRFKGGKIASDDEWSRLASTVLAEARAERFPSHYLKFDDLRTEFDAFRNAYWAKNPAATPRDEWDEHERRSLAASAKYLCQREILHQGHEWRCRQCFNNNWVSLDDLKRVMVCEVCGRNEPAPVANSWHFKINGFVLEGLREHGLLPIVWCLAKCAERATMSYFYLDPHELFFSVKTTNKGASDAELDLLVVSDGVVRLVEGKASGQGIEIDKTAELAKRLRPDVVTLAVMEPRSAALTKKLTDLQQQLAGTDIAADLMTLDAGDIDVSPTLPTGTSYWVRLL